MKDKKNISLLLVLLVGFIDWVGIGLVYPMFSTMIFQPDSLLLPLDTTHAMRGLCLGLLLSVMPTVLFFSAPIMGAISDQRGRKTVLCFGLAAGVVGYIIAILGVWQQSLALLLFSRVVIGISAGTGAVVEAAVADLSTPTEKTKNFGLFNMACGFGFTVGPFLGGKCSEADLGFVCGYQVPFFLACFSLLINLILIIFFFYETYIPTEKLKLSLFAGITNIREAFKNGALRVLFLVAFIACAGWSFYWEFIPVTWMSQHHFSTSQVGNIYAYGAAVYALSCGWLIRPLINRFSALTILFYSMIGCGLATAAMAIHSDENWLWVYVPLQQFTIALFFPTSTAIISNSVDETMQGEVLGVLQSVQALAFAVSPLMAGSLLGLSLNAPILVGSISMFLAAFVLLRCKTEYQPYSKKI